MRPKINEEYVLQLVRNVISEETQKVSRNDYNKIQYKIEELENSLMETLKELRKVNDATPEGLRVISDKRIKSIEGCLNDAHTTIKTLKSKIKDHKRNTFQSNNTEK
jgi:hypothetical protein